MNISIGNDFTSDVQVRRAINLAIDRNEMIDNVLSGYGSPAYSVCDKMPWYNDAAQVGYDAVKAADILDKAGWVIGGDGIREKDGVRASMTLMYPASDSVRQALAADTANQLKDIYHTMKESGLAEYSPYANETVDRYMDAALASSDLEQSYELWKKAQWDGNTGITQDGDIPWIWLVNIDHLYWARENLKVADQKLHPHGHGWSIVNNVDQWSWE